MAKQIELSDGTTVVVYAGKVVEGVGDRRRIEVRSSDGSLINDRPLTEPPVHEVETILRYVLGERPS